jgi:mono/diheme cytochrome c family protein
MTCRSALCFALVALTLAGAIPALAQETPTRVERGGKWFMDNGCYGCHMVGKVGSPIGPDLSHVGTKYPLDYLERWLRDPLVQRPNAHMPKLELSEAQVRAVAAYLSALR